MTMHASRSFADIAVGARAETEHLVRLEDLILFAHAGGDLNPLYMPAADKDADGRIDDDAEASPGWIAARLAALVGADLPGPGARIAALRLEIRRPARVGETLRFAVEVREKRPPDRLLLHCAAYAGDGACVLEGEIEASTPAVPMTAAAGGELPGLIVKRHVHVQRLLDACQGLAPLAVAVAAPESQASLAGPLQAAARGLIRPILIGDPARIAAAAQGLDLAGVEILQADHEQAAARAVALVHEGRAEAVMKGDLHTDELLRHVVKSDTGLRTGRRLSHVFVFDVPGLPHLLHISDAAMAIAPSLEEKVDIVQNAIDLALALGSPCPRVGVLAAVETVNPKMPATLDAAALAKMSERGQIRGGQVDGPLAMDNAMDIEAARTKGVKSLVAGRAEVLIVPNIEAGNILVKELSFVSHAEGAGIVLGAKAPVILTSRADDETSRIMSCAIAVLHQYWKRTGKSRLAPDASPAK